MSTPNTILKTINRIYSAWGKDTSIDNFKNNYWVYVTAALNGIWGTTKLNDITVHHIGQVCLWKTGFFTAASTTALTIPIKSNEDYSITINNITTGVVSCAKVNSNTNEITLNLTAGNEYQIISSPIKEKDV